MGPPADSSEEAKIRLRRWNTLKFEGYVTPNKDEYQSIEYHKSLLVC